MAIWWHRLQQVGEKAVDFERKKRDMLSSHAGVSTEKLLSVVSCSRQKKLSDIPLQSTQCSTMHAGEEKKLLWGVKVQISPSITTLAGWWSMGRKRGR